MAEPKNCPIMVNLEPTVNGILQQVLSREGLSASAYGRDLVIADLRRRGELTDDMLVRVFTATGAR